MIRSTQVLLQSLHLKTSLSMLGLEECERLVHSVFSSYCHFYDKPLMASFLLYIEMIAEKDQLGCNFVALDGEIEHQWCLLCALSVD